MKVYLAGPITGLTYDEAADWRLTFQNSTAGINLQLRGYQFASPMRGKETLAKRFMGGPLPDNFEGERPAVARDLWDIDTSQVVLANLLDAERVSIGTMCELGYAKARGRFVIVVMERTNAVHEHLFVRELASVRVETLDEAIDVLREL